MNIRSALSSVVVATVRSISGGSGAFLGAVLAVSYLVGGMATEISFGRAGPNQLAGTIVFALPVLTVLGVGAGALVGFVVRSVVERMPFAGPSSRRAVVSLVILAAAIGGLSGARAAVRSEEGNRPRVIETSGVVRILEGESVLAPLTPATLVFQSLQRSEGSKELVWRGQLVEMEVEGELLMIDDRSGPVDRVTLDGLDYVREVYGVVADLAGDGREWLAVLVRLRATGRRELLLIYDHNGTLTHKELLARTASGRGPVLWSAGAPIERQEFVLDLGEVVRYAVSR